MAQPPDRPDQTRPSVRSFPWRVSTPGGDVAGEIVLSPVWHPDLAVIASDSVVDFRLVALTSPGSIPPEQLSDPRVLCWVPAPAPETPFRPGDRRIAETQMAYRTVPIPDPLAVVYGARGCFISGLQTSDEHPAVTWDALRRALTAHVAAVDAVRSAAAPYLAALLENASPDDGSGEAASVVAQQRLAELRRNAVRLHRALINAAPEEPGDDFRSLAGVVARLSAVSDAAGVDAFGLAAERTYGDPASFRADLARYRNLEPMTPVLESVAAAVQYLRGMTLRPQDRLLDLERRECLLQANPAYVVETPPLWDGIRHRLTQLQRAYKQLYVAAHQEYYRETAAQGRRLADLAPDLRALEALNTLPELGPALGPGLREAYTGLARVLTPCTTSDGDLELETVPVCRSCGVALTDSVPVEAVDELAYVLKQALGEQQRRLSSRAVEQILARSSEPHVVRLLQVVRAGDLSPLVNVLDDHVVAFLRELLTTAKPTP